MNAISLLSVVQFILAFGIVISVLAAFITCRGDFGKIPSNIYYFASQVFVTVFLAMQATVYAQQQRTGSCIFMLLGVFAGVVSIIVVHAKKCRDAAGPPLTSNRNPATEQVD
jgi:hypothetical protein